MKKILLILMIAFMFSAVNPWPSILTIVNYTGQDIFYTLKYRGVQEYFLTATIEGNTDTYNISKFDIERKVYSAVVTACNTTTKWGRLNMNTNVRNVFTTCNQMKQWWTPKYWGEPTLEKPNFFESGGFQWTPMNMGWYGLLSYKGDNVNKKAFSLLYDIVE